MTFVCAGLVAAGSGCSRPAGSDPPAGSRTSPAPQAAPDEARRVSARLAAGTPLTGGERGEARPANRCGECHGALHAEWIASGHARSNRSPIYTAMTRSTERAACDPCHAPLTSLVPPGDLIAGEGINCDACHVIKDVDVSGARARISFGLTEATRWGTLCETQEHYFHKMGCLPLYRESRVCAGCHRWSISSESGVSIAILTEYDEWLASPAKAAGVTCQACHMPREQAEIATGWKRLAPIGSHSFMGKAGHLRRDAIGMRLSVEDRDDEVHAEVSIKNTMNGHSAPTGLPGRQLVLRVALLDSAGHAVDQTERIYSRVLVDDAGKEVPFHAARTQASDSRLGPGEARSESFSFHADGPGTLAAQVIWRRISPAIAAALDLPPEEQVLSEARIPFGPRGPRGHELLPKTIAASSPAR